MAQSYRVVAVSSTVKEWAGNYGPMKTYRLKLEGLEDVVELNKKPESPAPKQGDELFGTVEDSEFGKKFKAERQMGAFGSTRGGYQPRPDHHEEIKAQWSIGQAVQWQMNVGEGGLDLVEDAAKQFFAMVERVKGGEARSSGYEQAKETRARLEPDKVVDVEPDEEVEEKDIDIGDGPIDLDAIPF